NYLEQLGKELKNNVEQTVSIGLIGRWKEGPDQKFSVRYEVNFKGQVCHALLFTVQGRQIRIDDHVFVVGDQTAFRRDTGKYDRGSDQTRSLTPLGLFFRTESDPERTSVKQQFD